MDLVDDYRGRGDCSFNRLLVFCLAKSLQKIGDELSDHRIRHGRFKSHNGFIRPGITEFFAREAFDGFRIVAQGFNIGFKLFGIFIGLLDVFFQFHDALTIAFVLLDERQVIHADEREHGNDHKADDDFRQFAPDAKVNIHAAS